MRIMRTRCTGLAGALGLSLCMATTLGHATPGQPGVGLASARNQATAGPDHEMRIKPLADNQMQAADALGLTTTPQIPPWEQLTVRRGDTLSGVFARADLPARAWAALIHQPSARALKQLHPGDVLHYRKTPTGELAELRFKIDRLRTLSVHRRRNGLVAAIDHRPTQTRQILASGTIDGSLSESLRAEGVPSRITEDLEHIYRYRHDLDTLHQGDRFAVVYNAIYADNEEIGTGEVVAARITTNHRILESFRGKSPDGGTAYYDGLGKAYEPKFSRKPVAYTRISSPFNMHRLHPITHRVSPHEGVDMAAPTGTPVHAAADGVIKYASWMSGYGRLVEIKNAAGFSTRYGHLHRFRSHLAPGQHVSQGDIIGYVGESGRATGPHLHFEIRRNGVPHNPLTMKLPGGHDLPDSRLATFERHIQPLIARMSPAPTTLLAKTASTPANGRTCLGHDGFQTQLIQEQNDPADGILCLLGRRATSA